MPDNLFKKAVNNRWDKRSYDFQGKAQRWYTSTFARAKNYVETAREYEGLSARARHMRAVDLAKLMAFGLAHGYVHA